MKTRFLFLALLAAGCAGQKETVRPNLAAPAGTAPAAPSPAPAAQQPQISNRALVLYEDAVKAYDAAKRSRSFDYPALERKFQAALDADHELAEAEFDLGVLAERQGNVDQAVGHYQAALRIKSTLRQAAENLAVIAQNRGDVKGAVEIYKDILAKYPDDASSRARLAEIYRRQGDQDKAMELAREALIREPKTLGAYKVMMRSYLDRRQLSMAKLVALRAMKIDEADPELYHTVGLILLAEKDPLQAQLQFERAVEVKPDYLPAHVELAKIAMQLENYSGAEQHLRRVLQADGKNAGAHLNLGVAYKGLGQYDKAMQEYDEAEKLNPNLPAVYLDRAIVLHRFKDAPDRAIELYKKYIAMSGDSEAAVMDLLKEAETLVQAKAEAAAAEAEAKKHQGEKKPEGETAPASGAAPAQGTDAAQAQPASGAEPDAKEAPKPQPKPAPKPEAKPAPAGDPPPDEPKDNL